MGLKILVLGAENSNANLSYRDVLQSLGSLTYRLDKTYKTPEDLIHHLRKEQFDCVAMSNPYLSERRLNLYRTLKRASFPTLVCDRGGLPDSWFFDTGFNADSETYHPEYWDRSLDEAEIQNTREYIGRIKDSDHALEAQGQRVGAVHLRKTLGIGNKKVLFVPFQRPNDATIRYFSGFVRDIAHFSDIIDDIQRLFDLYCPDWTVIAKQHPLETDALSDRILTAPAKTHIHDLLELSTAVCLINSGVGLLAALFNKPVFHFGKTYYSHPNLNRSVQSASDVIACIRNEPFSFCEDTRDRLIHYLRHKVYSFGTPKSELVPNKDGSFKHVVSNIQFHKINLPQFIADGSTVTPKRSLLFITPVIPIPINKGSAQRTDAMIRALRSLGISVDILALNKDEPAKSSSQIEERLSRRYPGSFVKVVRHPNIPSKQQIFYEYIHYGKHKIYKFLQYFNLKRFMITNESECPSLFTKKIREYTSLRHYDTVYFNYAKTNPFYCPQNESLTICDTHDVQSNSRRNYYKSVKTRHPLIVKFLLWIFEYSEKKVLRQFNHLIAISPAEIADLKTLSGGRPHVHCIPAFFDDTSFSEEAEHPPYDLLFIGSASNPNAYALLWFLEHILPQIQQKRPSTKLCIAGNIVNHPKVAEALAIHDKTIEPIGFIPKLEQIYAQTKVIICPIRYGTGMKIKVVEALSMSCPIIGTSVAFEGINASDGVNAMLADDPEAFAAKALQLLENKTLRNNMRQNAHTLFMEQHSISAQSAKIERLLERLYKGLS